MMGMTIELNLKDSENELDKFPTVEAIPKDQYEARLKENNELINDLEELRTMINKFAESYENRLKADKIAMLEEIESMFWELTKNKYDMQILYEKADSFEADFNSFIQEKINSLKEG